MQRERPQPEQQQVGEEQDRDTPQAEPPRARERLGRDQQRGEPREHGDDLKRREGGVEIGEAGPRDDTAGAVQQVVAGEPVAGAGEQQDGGGEQHEVPAGAARDGEEPRSRPQVSLGEVGERHPGGGEQRGEPPEADQRPQERQGEDVVADVALEHRVGEAERGGMAEAQPGQPLRRAPLRHQESDAERHGDRGQPEHGTELVETGPHRAQLVEHGDLRRPARQRRNHVGEEEDDEGAAEHELHQRLGPQRGEHHAAEAALGVLEPGAGEHRGPRYANRAARRSAGL